MKAPDFGHEWGGNGDEWADQISGRGFPQESFGAARVGAGDVFCRGKGAGCGRDGAVSSLLRLV